MTEGVFIIEITFFTPSFTPSVSLRSTAPSPRERILLYGLRTTAFQPPLCKGRCRTNVRRRDCEVDFIWFYKILQSFFCSKKNASSLYKGAFDGQGRALSLRYVVVCFVSLATAFGCLSLTTQLLLFRKNHARLTCSVVNALTTAHCRYQLLRIADNRKGCPYGTSSFASYRSQQPLAVSHSLRNSSFSAKITLGSPVRL